jgi:hypothetical protein
MSTINYLELIDDAPFPMTKAEIVSWCEDQGASEEALDVIQAIPEGAYKSITEFNIAIGKIEQQPGGEMNQFSSSQSM